jgi:hypothetical protein
MAKSASRSGSGSSKHGSSGNASPPRPKSARGASSRAGSAASKATRKRGAKEGAARATPAGAKGRRGASAGARAKAPAARRPRARRPAARAETTGPDARLHGLSEEDEIRSSKYLPRDLPKRLFEEERFLFPESYGVDRVRLLVKDPEWLFAYWDVSPDSLKKLGRSLGERALALSRLTLRITDPTKGGASDILLPPGARWWYVRTDDTRRSYRAELGVTLPSGEFRRLAESNTVITPRVGPSSQRATRRISYRQAGEIPPEAGVAVSLEEMRSAATAPGPWSAPSVDGAAEKADAAAKGGASDVFRPGGASDTFRR